MPPCPVPAWVLASLGIDPYSLPNVAIPARPAHTRAVKRHAARAARTAGLYPGRPPEPPAHHAAVHRLRVELGGCRTRELLYWCVVVVIDDRWCAAQGVGGYWATASAIVNAVARCEYEARWDDGV